MKKALIALLSMTCIAMGDVVYTWDFSTDDAIMGGSTEGSFVTKDYTPNQGVYRGETITTLYYTAGGTTSTKHWYETGTNVFYNAINDAIAGKVTLTISGAVSTGTRTDSSYQTILHIGSNDKGLSLGLAGEELRLTNANVGSPGLTLGSLDVNSDANKSYYLTNFSVTIGKGGAVSYSIGGADEETAENYTFKTNWSTTLSDNYQYTVGSFLPGGTSSDHYMGKYWGSLAPLTVTIKTIPEPTTATLSLLALAGLAARRRRK